MPFNQALIAFDANINIKTYSITMFSNMFLYFAHSN